MTILVVYGSLHVGGRIIYSLAKVKSVEILGQATEADEALQLIAVQKPQAVIVDVQLQKGTGLNVLRMAKQLDVPPIVIMAGESSYHQFRRESLKQGADYYFQLPEEIDQMISTISSMAKTN
jgi:DNA-binding NarL/FixJ family response regulator